VNEIYRKTQVGWATIALGAALAALSVRLFYVVPQSRLDSGAALMFYVPVGLIVLYLINFSVMSLALDEHGINVAFGPGLLAYHFRYGEVKTVRTVYNPWYLGWGILKRRGIRMYSVGPGRAVELETPLGPVRLGTPEPERVAEIIQRRIGAPQS
jgi:hypothetical protein